MSKLKEFLPRIVLSIVAVLFAVMVKSVDVKAIGPLGSEVGFASINETFANSIGVNGTIYKISEVFGYLCLLGIAAFACLGLVQLIKRKSLLKVDRQIYVLGGFYVIVLLLYVLFDKVALNYRPVLVEGELEASFPSSHTMLATFVGLSAIKMLDYLLCDKTHKLVANIVIGTIMLGTIITRLLSGYHWLSDVIGGLLISAAIYSLFSLLVDKLCISKAEEEKAA